MNLIFLRGCWGRTNQRFTFLRASNHRYHDGTGLLLQLPADLAYQWEQDGQIVNGADSATFLAKTSAKYRADFRERLQHLLNLTGMNWSPIVDIKSKCSTNPASIK